MEKFLETISVINSPGIQQTLFTFRIVLSVIGILLLLFSIYILMHTAWMRFAFLYDITELFTYRPYGLRRISRRWQRVMARLETANEAEYKLAVIEADTVLSEILQRMGFKGETLGDRLRILTSAIVPNLNDVSQAHQTRNNVVHDPDYRLTLEEARKTLEIYEVAFRNLDLL
tara:strand:- start:657 stop:1175 length:519 start_codon:yes stop_codon:yes gene_type:complete